ncbi:MAG: cytochrome c [Kofleriaceae bacterium]
MRWPILIVAACGGNAPTPVAVVTPPPVIVPDAAPPKLVMLDALDPDKPAYWIDTDCSDESIRVPLGIQVRVNIIGGDLVFWRADVPAAYTWTCNDKAMPIAVMSASESELAYGMQVYQHKGCSSCHTLDGTPRVGPSWKGSWGTKIALVDGTERVFDAAYAEESIKKPEAASRAGFLTKMPSFEGMITADEIAALVALMQSLGESR